GGGGGRDERDRQVGGGPLLAQRRRGGVVGRHSEGFERRGAQGGGVGDRTDRGPVERGDDDEGTHHGGQRPVLGGVREGQPGPLLAVVSAHAPHHHPPGTERERGRPPGHRGRGQHHGGDDRGHRRDEPTADRLPAGHRLVLRLQGLLPAPPGGEQGE